MCTYRMDTLVVKWWILPRRKGRQFVQLSFLWLAPWTDADAPFQTFWKCFGFPSAASQQGLQSSQASQPSIIQQLHLKNNIYYSWLFVILVLQLYFKSLCSKITWSAFLIKMIIKIWKEPLSIRQVFLVNSVDVFILSPLQMLHYNLYNQWQIQLWI